MNQPVPDQTANGPAYQGRLLPHPDDEVVDQGLQFDVQTVFSRRRMLSLVGIGAGALTLAACGADSSSGSSSSSTSSGSLTEIPDETNGPYPADGTNGPDILEQTGIVRSDITSSFGDATGVAEGVPFTFTYTIIDMANGNQPWEGAAVYVWHCDRDGNYSMYSKDIENENYLRGVQVADANGQVTFTSIYPACYSGRWPHIHFEVYPDVDSITDHDNCVSTSQMAFPEDTCNDVYNNADGYSSSVKTFSQVSIDDGIFDSDTIDLQMVTLSGDISSGFTGTFTVPVDTTTEQTGGGSSGGPDGGSGGGPGGGSGGPGGEGGDGGEGPGGTPPSGGSGEGPGGTPPSGAAGQPPSGSSEGA